MTPLQLEQRAFRKIAATWPKVPTTRRTELVQAFGQPSRVSKMPGACSPSLPPTTCHTGTQLRKIPGTPCASCYAERLRGAYPSAARRWTQNIRTLRRALADATEHYNSDRNYDHHATTIETSCRTCRWIAAGAELLRDEARRAGDPRVRWHVAGDLQSLEHLDMITDVCELTPELLHRLPTQEAGLVAQAHRHGWKPPANVKLTVSLARVDVAAPRQPLYPTSNVWTRDHLESTTPDGLVCPAITTHGACGPCSACWPKLDGGNVHVIYPKH